MPTQDDDPVREAAERAEAARRSSVDLGLLPEPTRPTGLPRASHHWPIEANMAQQMRAALDMVRENDERRAAALAKMIEPAAGRTDHEAADSQQPKRADADRLAAFAEENARLLVRQSRDMHDIRARLDPLGFDPAADAKAAVRSLPQAGTAETESLTDVGERLATALDDHYQSQDPYRSMGRAAMAEYSAFCREQDALAREIVAEPDPLAREKLELHAAIEAADYVESSSRRIAANDRTITGADTSEQSMVHDARAEECAALGADLRATYAEADRGHAAWLTVEDEVTVRRTTEDTRTQETQSERYGEKSATVESSLGSERAEFHDAGAEVTDSKATRLAALADRHTAVESRAVDREQQPGRSRGGGAEM